MYVYDGGRPQVGLALALSFFRSAKPKYVQSVELQKCALSAESEIFFSSLSSRPLRHLSNWDWVIIIQGADNSERGVSH
jgi:hypothetical protein